jgi:hypothetical protein
MTHIEANKLIDACHSIASCDGNAKITAQLLDEAAQALHKQVPMKLKHEKFTDDPYSPDEEYWLCPRCSTDMYNSLDAVGCISMEYCPWCGQRIEL